MSPALARPLLHTLHLLTFAVLFITGLLLFVPNLRAAVTGGYSLLIREAHRWGGVAFAVVPVLIVARCGVRTVFVPPAARTRRTRWQALHVGATVAMALAFTVTGLVIWDPRMLPDPLVDPSRSLHDGLTYAAAAFVGLHLCEVGVAAVVARWRAAAAVAAPHS
jgi:cytochrome b subunit of formate dehydrogenase